MRESWVRKAVAVWREWSSRLVGVSGAEWWAGCVSDGGFECRVVSVEVEAGCDVDGRSPV